MTEAAVTEGPGEGTGLGEGVGDGIGGDVGAGQDGAAPGAGEPGRKEGPSGVAQAVTAILLFGGTAALLWGLGVFGHSTTPDGKPAACNAPTETDAPEYPALCAALNRPDLPTLVGLPAEHVSVAQSGGGPMTFADGTKVYDASAKVQLGSLMVQLTDNHRVGVQDSALFAQSKDAPTSVLGHPAMTYSDHTMKLSLGLTGGSAGAGKGGVARHLVVAKDAKAGAGSFELTVWRQDFTTPDDAALFRVAEQVLPTLQGWVAGA
ncbi:DUF6215 domain-containing protein [Kitasatospora sp. NPDC047058]|uniref:DUF6215 domain-containing protein n=1 Tax=Kitasatospora sp. NPDC047058 TaxID=3155620 RepID=UPI0033CA6AD1